MEYSKFTFSKPQLLESSFKINNNFKSTLDPIEISTNFEKSMSVNREDKSAEVVMTVSTGKEKDNAPFFVSVTMGANFKWVDDGLTDREIQNFINCNASALLIGYIRPIVAFLTAQSPFPPYHIPFVDLSMEENNDEMKPQE